MLEEHRKRRFSIIQDAYAPGMSSMAAPISGATSPARRGHHRRPFGALDGNAHAQLGAGVELRRLCGRLAMTVVTLTPSTSTYCWQVLDRRHGECDRAERQGAVRGGPESPEQDVPDQTRQERGADERSRSRVEKPVVDDGHERDVDGEKDREGAGRKWPSPQHVQQEAHQHRRLNQESRHSPGHERLAPGTPHRADPRRLVRARVLGEEGEEREERRHRRDQGHPGQPAPLGARAGARVRPGGAR